MGRRLSFGTKLDGVQSSAPRSFWLDPGRNTVKFLALKQDGSIREYLRLFELLAATLKDVPEHVQERTFINGLKPEIRSEVMMMKPEGLREVMKFTQRVEERTRVTRTVQRGLRGIVP